MILGTGPQSNRALRRRAGFTLIEMILVMALLVVAVSMVSPRLAGFIRARTLESETRRLLSLSNAARARAISEGSPVILWLDASTGRYGMELETPGKNGDPNSIEFTADADLQVAFATATSLVGQTATSPRPVTLPATRPMTQRNLPSIRMLPDGSVDESSPEAIRISDTLGGTLWLVEGSDRRHYETRTNNR